MPNDNVLEQASHDASEQAPRALVLLLFAETPVHPGAAGGKAALDLPIQRSVQTEWPIINDATLRGGLRRRIEAIDSARGDGSKKADKFFGDANNPGHVSTPDAEVLLFPVASAKGMTAWITCKTALEYFVRKLCIFRNSLSNAGQQKADKFISLVRELRDGLVFVTTPSALTWSGNTVILESDSFAPDPEPQAPPVTAAADTPAGGVPVVAAPGTPVVTPAEGDLAKTGAQRPVDALAKWFSEVLPATEYWKDRLKTHFVIVPEQAFTHYVLRKTDIRTRVKIGEGRVEQGPWTEENIPVDTLLYTVVSTLDADGGAVKEFDDLTKGEIVQFGGDQNLGRGMLRIGKLGGN